MSILSKMGKLFELATSDAKSSDIEIDELIQYSKIDIPHEYLEIIEEKTELEILVNNKKYIRIWGANGCIEMNDAYHIQKYIPDSLAVGDDECSNAVLYANGNNGFGLYIVSFSDLGVDEMVYIADSLEAFFVNEEGIDIFNNIW
ncbi:MAG: SMI1/KNR4 family protein [Lachnospiraceae bacterium]|nr:SMI1/KNR4 family protein [Lachnospiraceae bacterium]